ncbi:MAG: hypothetical protein IPK68_13570 [Bdellovibrionales bacterium]|nr:hypothetical protein [Bdellovibrionales bacterium]
MPFPSQKEFAFLAKYGDPTDVPDLLKLREMSLDGSIELFSSMAINALRKRPTEGTKPFFVVF